MFQFKDWVTLKVNNAVSILLDIEDNLMYSRDMSYKTDARRNVSPTRDEGFEMNRDKLICDVRVLFKLETIFYHYNFFFIMDYY